MKDITIKSNGVPVTYPITHTLEDGKEIANVWTLDGKTLINKFVINNDSMRGDRITI
jgi:hypothetical protein